MLLPAILRTTGIFGFKYKTSTKLCVLKPNFKLNIATLNYLM